MGLFDGAADGTPSSTADIARLLDAPVRAGGRRLGASRRRWPPSCTASPPTTLGRASAGVILNRVGLRRPRAAAAGGAGRPRPVPVVGALRRDDRLVVARPPSRPGAGGRAARRGGPGAGRAGRRRRPSGSTSSAVVALAARPPPRTGRPGPGAAPPGARRPRRRRIAVAGGAAFTFTYTDTLEALEAAGAEIVPFDPLRDPALPPAIDGLLAGGGFPEVHAEELAAQRARCWPTCAGGSGGPARPGPSAAGCCGCRAAPSTATRWPACCDADAGMTDRLTLGYRTAATRVATPLGPGRHRAARATSSTTRPSIRPARRCTSAAAGATGARATPADAAGHLPAPPPRRRPPRGRGIPQLVPRWSRPPSCMTGNGWRAMISGRSEEKSGVSPARSSPLSPGSDVARCHRSSREALRLGKAQLNSDLEARKPAAHPHLRVMETT